MCVKKVEKNILPPDTNRANQALRAIVAKTWGDTRPGLARTPIWELTGPLPDSADTGSLIPPIRSELINPVIILTDPHVLADFEASGLGIARIANQDVWMTLLWLIDKSRGLDGKKVDTEFAQDFAEYFRLRTLGKRLSEVAEKGHARLVATSDGRTVIVQFTPEARLPFFLGSQLVH